MIDHLRQRSAAWIVLVLQENVSVEDNNLTKAKISLFYSIILTCFLIQIRLIDIFYQKELFLRIFIIKSIQALIEQITNCP